MLLMDYLKLNEVRNKKLFNVMYFLFYLLVLIPVLSKFIKNITNNIRT
jgi:hypothetical protein